jgi:hypothetical protein
MEIGATNTTRLNGNLNLARPNGFDVTLFKPKVFGGVNDNSFHALLPVETCICYR